MKNNYNKRKEGMHGICSSDRSRQFFKYAQRGVLQLFLLLVLFAANAQDVTISGIVQEEDSGSPLPGVTVQVKGTSQGVITDIDGNFRISASPGDVLVFSFVGFVTKEVKVGGQTEISVSLATDIQQLSEVVVTALGIERDKKALTYSAQNVSTEEISEARSLNVVNSLSGKVAGLNFSTTGTGVGSSSRVTLRGNRSLTGNNQPLFIIDGVPMDNTVSSPRADIGGLTSFDGISNINPEDIASISVLKGPTAAALYGSRAGNGVIVITTKKGTKGRTNVTVSSNLMFSDAYDLLNQQNEYGQGVDGTYEPTSRQSWGPRMTGQMVDAWQLSHNPGYSGPATYALEPQPNNSSDFFNTGYNWAKTVSATMGNEAVSSYFSYTNTVSEGIVQGNRLDRHNLNLRLTGNLTKKLTFDGKATYINQKVENAIKAGETSVGEALYTLPRSMPFSQYKDFEYVDASGDLRYNYPSPETLGAVGGNPYWFALREPRTDARNRFIGMASLKYSILENLSLQVRTGLDQSNNTSNASRYANLSILNNDVGSYSESFGTQLELNSDFLLNYNKTFGDFNVNLGFGGNHLYQNRSSLSTGGPLSYRNFFTIRNVTNQNPSPGNYEKTINSLYGFANLSFKEYLFLDLTARSDWSSALPLDALPYDYYSVGVSAIVTDMFDVQSDVLSYLKLRASYAEVGIDTDPYRTQQEYQYFGVQGGFVQRNPLKANPNLKPEQSSSSELGLDARFLNGRIGLDFTWYQSNTKDQIFLIDIPVTSGFSREVVNGGEIKNTGVELVLNATVVEAKGFTWDVTANYASYQSEVVSILDDREELNLQAGGERLAVSKVKVGGEYGDLYIRGYLRDDNGNIVVNSTNGLPEFTPGFDVLAGNFNPDWTGGLKNQFTYENFNLSFLVDFRIGGEIISYSQIRMAGAGVSDITLDGREEGIVVDGVIRDGEGNITSTRNTTSISAQDYWTQVAGRNPGSSEDFIFDATNIRLRELVLGYSLPESLLAGSPFRGVNISLVGRNLFFFKNNAKYFDPEQGVSVGNLQGIESFNMPTTRNYGFNVVLNF